MRRFALLIATMLALGFAGYPLSAELTAGVELGGPYILLEHAQVLKVQRRCNITVPAGETVLAMPLGELGADPAAATLEVVDPAAFVRIATMEVTSDAPDTARWRLVAEEAGLVRLQLTYLVEGINWAIEYSVTLTVHGGAGMQVCLTVTNGLAYPLEDATFRLPPGSEHRTSLDAGETVSLPLLELMVPADEVERTLVYDYENFGDAPVELLTIDHAGLQGVPAQTGTSPRPAAGFADMPLLEGEVRLYAASEAGGDFIAQTSIPYVPPHEPLELKLGPASGIAVTRTRTQAKEVNTRQDVHHKTVLFDLDETYEIAVRNLRRSPVELIVREHPQDTWQVLRSSIAHLKTDARTLQFRLHLEAGQERKLTYQVRRLNLQP